MEDIVSRTQGYHVKLVPQGSSSDEERTKDEPEYIMDGDEPRLFMTAAQATDAGREHTMDKLDLTYVLEPVAP